MDLYLSLLRPLLFSLPAEAAHNLAILGLRLTPRAILRATFGPQPAEPVNLFGLKFPNPVGLAAGMDKNANALRAWESMGFGFVEAGTITALPQPGNPKPRSFRFIERQAIINRMGFNNDGASAVEARLRKLKRRGKWPRIPVGINIGKSKLTPNEQAASDYATSYRLLLPYGDYFVINVSSPNTPGLRALQDATALAEIIRTLKAIDSSKPLLVKIAPDLLQEDIRNIATMADLLNPVKLYPTSFSSLTLPTPDGPVLIYNTDGSVNSAIEPILNSGTVSPKGCDDLAKIVPSAQAQANRALQIAYQQVKGIRGTTTQQLAAILQ